MLVKNVEIKTISCFFWSGVVMHLLGKGERVLWIFNNY